MAHITPDKAAIAAARIAEDRKAADIVILDVHDLTTLCDYFVLCTGQSTTHTRAIADSIAEELPKVVRPRPPVEGYHDARWIILDCASVIVHVFSREARDFYRLERLWAEAPVVEGWSQIPAEASSGP